MLEKIFYRSQNFEYFLFSDQNCHIEINSTNKTNEEIEIINTKICSCKYKRADS